MVVSIPGRYGKGKPDGKEDIVACDPASESHRGQFGEKSGSEGGPRRAENGSSHGAQKGEAEVVGGPSNEDCGGRRGKGEKD